MQREITPDDLRAFYVKFGFHGRHQNPAGLKFYLLRSEKAGNAFWKDQAVYYFTFLVIPKVTSKSGGIIESYYHIAVLHNVALSYGLDGSLISQYLLEYGEFNLRQYLNTRESYDSFEKRINVDTENMHEYEPKVIAKKLDPPFDKDDYHRREQAVEAKVLEYALKTNGKEQFDHDFLLELCFCDEAILSNVVNSLYEKDVLEKGEYLQLTPKGTGYYKSLLSLENTASAQFSKVVFVAQSFSADMLAHFTENVEPMLKALGFQPLLINRAEPQETVDIEILRQIDGSKFVVCDLTYERPSVYCEAGYALGKNKRVFFTSRADHNTDHPSWKSGSPKVHFDLRNRQITWWEKDKGDAFQAELKERIERWLDVK